VNDTDPARPDRRHFSFLAAGLAVLTAGGVAGAADGPQVSTADALAELVRARLGEVLTPEQQKRLAATLARGRLRGESLKRPPLDNGDDPAQAFTAEVS
jgi:hypothetical protein